MKLIEKGRGIIGLLPPLLTKLYSLYQHIFRVYTFHVDTIGVSVIYILNVNYIYYSNIAWTLK